MQTRFREFAAAGDFRTQTEFFNHLLTLYAAQETGIRVPTLEGAISAVNELSDRINKILIGAGETISANQEKEREQIATLQREADKKVSSLVIENESLKTGFEEQARMIEAVRNELSEAQEHNFRGVASNANGHPLSPNGEWVSIGAC
jgi:predicted RNase H-like nuclease (RuvC/YqgF family)